MKGFLKRLRGIIGTGLTWAVGFVAIGLGDIVVHGSWEYIFRRMPGDVILGFIFGGAFAVVLSVAERHRRLEDLSLWRVALWGASGAFLTLGATYLVFWGELLAVNWGEVLWLALIAGGFSSGSLALARRGESKLLEGEDDSVLSLEEELEVKRIG